MDPISAFSLFCNVAQTVETAVKTGQTLVELYRSSYGLAKDTQSLSTATVHLSNSIRVLRDAQAQLQPATTSAGSTQMASIARECDAFAKKIQILLDKCKVKKKGSIMAAGGAMIRSRWYKSELADLQKEMETSRDSLAMAISVASGYVLCHFAVGALY